MENLLLSEHKITEQRHRFSQRFLVFLDQAYEIAESSQSIDGLMAAADSLFFPLSGGAALATDLADAYRSNDSLDRHIVRLEALVSGADPDSEQLNSDPYLASLVLTDNGRRAIGNAAAAALLGCRFPCSLYSVEMSETSRKDVLRCLRDAESGCLEGSRVIKIELLEHQRLYFARCTKLQFRGPDGNDRTGLGVLINHVDWQKNAILKAAKMFGLTRAEAHLLGYLLRGCSQTAAARAMSKSRETVRAQAKSILRKTKTTQMSDVIQLMTGYMFMTEDQPAPAHAAPATADFPDQGEVLRLPNGRRVQINRLGQKGGRPLMFFHGLYPGPFITPTLNDQFRAAGFDVLAASRPGFNGTDAPGEWAHFEQQVTEDVVAICDVLGWTKLDFLVHQTGTSFACRAAQALEGRVGSAVMVGASVPIKDDMLKTMTRDARVAAAAVKYAPKVLELIFRVSVAQLRQQGSYTFLANKMAHSAVEFETLDHPETGPVIERSLHHLASGGPEAIMQDGACAMSDWETAYHYLPKRQLWLHGARDPVINVQFVREFLERQGQAAPVIYADRGGDVLLAEAKDVVARLSTFLDEGAA